MLRMGHKDNWIPFARRSLQNFQARQGKKAASAHNENIMGLGAHHILNHLNPSLYLHPSSEVSVLFHQYTSTPRMISTDLVIQQPWGSIILCVELPQLCGYKREDILLFCNRKSLSRAKNLEL